MFVACVGGGRSCSSSLTLQGQPPAPTSVCHLVPAVTSVCRVERNPAVFASNWVPLWAGAADPGSDQARWVGLVGRAGVWGTMGGVLL